MTGYDISAGQAGPTEAAAKASGGGHASSSEQMFRPITIKRGESAKDGGGGVFNTSNPTPTFVELSPYFSSAFGDNGQKWIENVDFSLVANDGTTKRGGEGDLNIRKTTRSSITEVRPMGLRGPLLMTGFGFGHDHLPIPAKGGSGTAQYEFDPEAAGDSTKWQTGPVDLCWDKQRLVWTANPQVLMGVLNSSITPASSICSPTTFTIKILRTDSSKGVSNCTLNEILSCKNRDPSLEQSITNAKDSVFVIVQKINYEWIPIWVGCPDEEIPSKSNSCIC